MHITDYIEREDLGGDMAELADALGLETVRKLFRFWRGCAIYVPSRVPRDTMRRYISAEAQKGRKVRSIARELGVSERYAQSLLHNSQSGDAQILLPLDDID